MDSVLQRLLSLVLIYGYPAVGGAEFLSSAGAPLPMSPILLLSGSLAAVGGLNGAVLFAVVAGTSIAGDCLDYYLGRRLGSAAVEWLAGLPFVPSGAVQRAHRFLAQRAGTGIFLSRWLFTPVSSLVSVLAGAAGYPWRAFLPLDIGAEIFAAGIWLGVGYVFGASWQEFGPSLGNLPVEATVAALGLLLIAFAVRRLLTRRQGADPP